MGKLMRKLILGLAAAPSVASASLIHVTPLAGDGTQQVSGFSQPFVDGEVSITFDDGFPPFGPGFAHIDRSSITPIQFIDFTSSMQFLPSSVDIRPLGSGYCSNGDPLCGEVTPDEDPIPYIWFSGFLNEALISTFGLFRPQADEYETIDLSVLGRVDLLRIESKNYFDLGLPGTCNGGNGCGHFNVDNVKLVSVPESGTLSLLIGGILSMLVLHRRKRCAHSDGH